MELELVNLKKTYENFLKSIEKDSYRVKITEPFELITDLKKEFMEFLVLMEPVNPQ